MKATIKCENIIKTFGNPQTQVLKSMDFQIYEGEFVSITGRSGSGKSTLLYIISSLDTPTSGKTTLLDRDVHLMPEDDLHLFRNKYIGFVFQFHYLLPELSGLDNILMPARKLGLHVQKKDRALSLLNQFSISNCADKLPSQMSGGQMQRVSIARSLIMEPQILFADEPTGNLDSANAEKVMNIFEDINRENNTTIVMVTHEPDFAKRSARNIHLVDGVIESDTKKRKGDHNEKK